MTKNPYIEEQKMSPRTVIEQAAALVRALRQRHRDLAKFIRADLPIPQVHRGTGPIRLIVLGQDPTINDAAKVAEVTTVLNLDRSGPLHSYLKQLCDRLGLNLDQHLYATNLLKAFFVAPPVALARQVEIDLFTQMRRLWLPLLHDELRAFPGTSVLSLGEPLLRTLAGPGVSRKVRDYWGYTPQWKEGVDGTFAYLRADENRLQRPLYPFSHLTSARTKRFYSDRLAGYTRYLGMVSGILDL